MTSTCNFLKRGVLISNIGGIINSYGRNNTLKRSEIGWKHAKRLYTSSAEYENRQRRVELAAAYRAAEKCALHEGVDNHITVIAPARNGSGKQLMLVVPQDIYWSEITPSCLIGLDDNNEVVEGVENGTPLEAAVCIHRGVRKRNNHAAICHLHPPYSTALASLKDPELLMVHQTSARYVDRVAYDLEYGGVGHGDEGDRIAKVMGSAEVMVMGNHGVIFVGPSVATAFDRAYYFERVAMFQVLAMQTGRAIREIPDDIVLKTRAEYDINEDFWSKRHMFAYIKLFAKYCDEFKNYDARY